jgi:hypothetical protein
MASLPTERYRLARQDHRNVVYYGSRVRALTEEVYTRLMAQTAPDSLPRAVASYADSTDPAAVFAGAKPDMEYHSVAWEPAPREIYLRLLGGDLQDAPLALERYLERSEPALARVTDAKRRVLEADRAAVRAYLAGGTWQGVSPV